MSVLAEKVHVHSLSESLEYFPRRMATFAPWQKLPRYDPNFPFQMQMLQTQLIILPTVTQPHSLYAAVRVAP
jgi:hypothetical protein